MTTSSIDDGFAELGELEDFPLGAFRIVDVDGVEVGVLRRADGTVRAIRNRCPHHHAPICEGQLTGTILPCDDPRERRYGMEGSVLRCPWHAYEFDIDTGRSVLGTYRGRLQSFDADVDSNGRVRIRRPQAEPATNAE
ncbi:MAG: Rieske (2Fe-2S) protein [Microbacteriaceae bacterium]